MGAQSPAGAVVVGSGAVSARPLSDLVDPGWAAALEPVAPQVAAMGRFLRAFTQPLDAVRVLIVGQDPYPTPGHPVGLSFSVAPDVRPLPRSLRNIITEYQADLGLPHPSSGDLTRWAEHGVLLLNRVLTVQPGKPASHRGKGWEAVTDAAIAALLARDEPLVAILWGRDAQSLAPALLDVPTVMSPHPSPMSADRGFFGSRPFTRANEHLDELGESPVDWRLP